MLNSKINFMLNLKLLALRKCVLFCLVETLHHLYPGKEDLKIDTHQTRAESENILKTAGMLSVSTGAFSLSNIFPQNFPEPRSSDGTAKITGCSLHRSS